MGCQVGGAFFDDTSAAAAQEMQCGCPGCQCRCGNWSATDQADFFDSTLGALELLLSTMSARKKLPILSTDDGGCPTVGTTPDCSGAGGHNPYALNFTVQAAGLLRKHGGWRFLEPLGQGISYCSGSKCNTTGLAVSAQCCFLCRVRRA